MAGTWKHPIDFIPDGSRLTFIKVTRRKKYPNGKVWVTIPMALYKCSCGEAKEMMISNVHHSKSLSCGCLTIESAKSRSTHGLSKHPLFRVWNDIKTRCENKRAWAYQYYGALGVRMCKEWRHDFQAFYDWAIANGWERGKDIDKDKKAREKRVKAKVYSPEFCSIITRRENCNTRKSNHLITYNGKTQNLAQWEADIGVSQDMLYSRLKSGWSSEEALTTPKLRTKKRK